MFPSDKGLPQRFIRRLQHSRDGWKQRATEKQRRLRAQAIRIRDLEHSRALWKHRAQVAERQLRARQASESSALPCSSGALDGGPEPFPPLE
jgi:hypothetical protein